jgi:hypothetical protein
MKRIMSDSKVVLQNRKYSGANILFNNTQSSIDLESELSDNPGSERQPAHRTTSASLHLFPRQVPEDHLQTHQYQPRNGIFILIQSTMHILLKDKSN